MDIKTKYASPLILKDILISESKFSRVESSIENVELGINVERELEKLSEEEYRIVLEVMVTDGNEKVNIYVKCVANFNTDKRAELEWWFCSFFVQKCWEYVFKHGKGNE